MSTAERTIDGFSRFLNGKTALLLMDVEIISARHAFREISIEILRGFTNSDAEWHNLGEGIETNDRRTKK